jgi:hypothetical protein
VTRYAPLWQQANTYAATLDRALLAAAFPYGGLLLPGGAVTAVAATMNVSVAPGTMIVPLQAGQGSAVCRWDAAEVVTLAAAPPGGQSRIDLVVCQVRDNALDSGGNNDFVFTNVTGTPAASNPAVPATPTNALACTQVLVPGGVANLNTATLTEVRNPANGLQTLFGRVSMTAATTTIGVTPYTVPYDTVNRDPQGMWNVAGKYFRVPFPGVYLCWCEHSAPNTVASSNTTAAIWVNGAIRSYGAGMASNAANMGLAAVTFDELLLAAGDQVQGVIYSGGGGVNTLTGLAGGVLTYLGIQYMHP